MEKINFEENHINVENANNISVNSPILSTEHRQIKVTVVEQNTNGEFELCAHCSNSINKLQHPNASYAIKFDEYFFEDCEKEEQANCSSSDYLDGDYCDFIDEKLSNNSKLDAVSIGKHNGSNEFEIIEKRLLNIEMRLQSTNKLHRPAEFKRLCGWAISCEDEWSKLFCLRNDFDLEAERENVLQLLRRNLDQRRAEKNPTRTIKPNKKDDLEERTSKKLPKPNEKTFRKVSSMPDDVELDEDKCYGLCVPVLNLAETPYRSYSAISSNPCIQLENQLLEIETKLKRLAEDGDTNNPEYENLVRQGLQIRDEWKIKYNMTRRPTNTYPKGYDKTKCLVKSGSRSKRRNKSPS